MSKIFSTACIGQTENQSNCLDSNQIKAIEILIDDNITLKNMNLKLSENSELYRLNQVAFKMKIDSLFKIMDLKDEQIKKLEALPRTEITVSSWKWWHYTLAALGAITFGFTAGIVYENTRR